MGHLPLTKMCLGCHKTKPLTDFHKSRANKFGRNTRCKDCRSKTAAQRYKDNLFHSLHILKKSRCKTLDIPYDLDEGYLSSIWTELCPISGVKLIIGNKAHPDQYALDRIKPKLGYIKGNVAFISARANRIKYDATIEELKQILTWMEANQ